MPDVERERLEKNIVDQISWDSRVASTNIRVSVEDGGVVLTGSVQTHLARLAAEEDAIIASGASWVDNNLEIASPSDEPTDAQIEDNVLRVLAVHPDLDSSHLAATSRRGVVTLSGSVEAYWQKVRAAALAIQVRGVVSIENELRVVPAGVHADEDILYQIIGALRRNVYFDADDVEVEVRDGVVVLSGQAPSVYAFHAAHDTAVRTAGVVEVISEVTLSPEVVRA